MLISIRFQRFQERELRCQKLNDASQNDLQNTKSLRVNRNKSKPLTALEQRAISEQKRLYNEAARKAGETFQDKYARIGGLDTLEDIKKILK